MAIELHSLILSLPAFPTLLGEVVDLSIGFSGSWRSSSLLFLQQSGKFQGGILF